jgi:hypothetical protein
LSSRSDPFSIEASRTIINFFQHNLNLIKAGSVDTARSNFQHLNEPNETCLGQSKHRPHPFRADPEQFHLIAPYDPDPRRWLQTSWIDEYSGNEYGIRTIGPTGDRYTARVKTYGEVIDEHEYHPESKCADSDGHPCQKETRGLLQRRRITIDEIKFIGKESNSLEEVEAGLIHDERSVYPQYVDPKRDAWATKTLPAIKSTKPSILIDACRGFLSSRALRDIRAGRSIPHRKKLQAVMTKLGTI